VLILRVSAYCAAAVKFHHFSSPHTYLNKLTGFLVFCVPYLIKTPVLTPCCIGVSAVALLAALEELLMHLCNKKYCEGKKTLVQCFFKRT
jgi:CDP-diacylglycerol--glycerol-3-phosphate 3-phosphatidyltransferase